LPTTEARILLGLAAFCPRSSQQQQTSVAAKKPTTQFVAQIPRTSICGEMHHIQAHPQLGVSVIQQRVQNTFTKLRKIWRWKSISPFVCALHKSDLTKIASAISVQFNARFPKGIQGNAV
jgi:hypothetical protein